MFCGKQNAKIKQISILSKMYMFCIYAIYLLDIFSVNNTIRAFGQSASRSHSIILVHFFTSSVLLICTSVKMHGKRILKLLQKIFSWLPLVTVIDHRVLVVHGGISDSTDLSLIARVDRHKVSHMNIQHVFETQTYKCDRLLSLVCLCHEASKEEQCFPH